MTHAQTITSAPESQRKNNRNRRPILALRQRVALAVPVPGRISSISRLDAWNSVTFALDANPAVTALCASNRVMELAQLVDEAIVEQQRPSVPLLQGSTSPPISSSGPV